MKHLKQRDVEYSSKPTRSEESYLKEARRWVPEVAELFVSEKRDPQGGGGRVPFMYRLADFRNSVARVPFAWDYLGTKYNMLFLAGFCGVSYNPENELLRAEIGWGVKDPQVREIEQQDLWEEFDQNVRRSGASAKGTKTHER